MELKVGYVLEVANAQTDTVSFAMVLPNNCGELVVSGPDMWFPIEVFDEELKYMWCETLKVYGHAPSMYAHRLSADERPILWECRHPAVNLTLQQIEEILGYPVNIVEENDEL